jgi:exopolyphosphatase/pppGpp-phosphohydrolase
MVIEKRVGKYREQIKKLCDICHCDRKHAQQVKKLALSIYDQVSGTLQLPRKSRRWLEFAALLHDIGMVNGRNGHHKSTLNIILSTPILDFKNKERFIIGSIARYHRRALPNKNHDHYAALESAEQEWVNILGIILRFANALDASHNAVVEKINFKFKRNRTIVQCLAAGKYEAEEIKVQTCLPLLEELLGTSIRLSWIQTPEKP